jgi:hypothetical protein
MKSGELWMIELVGAATEVAHAMGLGAMQVIGRVAPPREAAGVYLPIVGREGVALYVAWLAPGVGCEAMARALLGDLVAGPLSPGDVFDAMGEIVNIVAGAVKRRMRHADMSLALGLPIYAATPIVPVGARVQATCISCGGVDGFLVVIGNVGVEAWEAHPPLADVADE